MQVKVLGASCAKCLKLYDRVIEAVDESGVKVQVIKVEKLDDIFVYGVMVTPSLVVDNVVKSSGRLPRMAQIVTWLKEAAK